MLNRSAYETISFYHNLLCKKSIAFIHLTYIVKCVHRVIKICEQFILLNKNEQYNNLTHIINIFDCLLCIHWKLNCSLCNAFKFNV